MCANGAQTYLSYYHIIKGVFYLKTLKSISGAKIWFLALSAFVGLSSLNSAMALFIRPDGAILGIGELLPALEHLPFGAALFKNYIFAAVILLLACAVPNAAAAVLIFKERLEGIWMVLVCGVAAAILRGAKLWALSPDVYLPDFLLMAAAILQIISAAAVLIYRMSTRKKKNGAQK